MPLALGTLGVETLVILAFLMPMATTVVHFHREAAPKRLGVLLLVALVSIGVSAYRVMKKRDPLVSYATKQRARYRTAKNPKAAREAQTRALRIAWKVLPRAREDVDTDGKVEGAPLEAMRDGLEPFYKDDETYAWDLWYTKAKVDGKPQKVLAVYFAATRGKDAKGSRSIRPTSDDRSEATSPRRLQGDVARRRELTCAAPSTETRAGEMETAARNAIGRREKGQGLISHERSSVTSSVPAAPASLR